MSVLLMQSNLDHSDKEIENQIEENNIKMEFLDYRKLSDEEEIFLRNAYQVNGLMKIKKVENIDTDDKK